MLPLDHPDRIQITFDDRRLVANGKRGRLAQFRICPKRGPRPGAWLGNRPGSVLRG